jgi:tetratricopeptide (TPR) repeat protein
VAYTLIAASRESDGSYAPDGLESAMAWLEKAQETEPDILLINMIEALIYIYSGRFDDARIILNYLHQQDSDNYHLHLAEMAFEQEQGHIEKAGLWYEQAVESALNVPQRLRLQARMGDFYLKHDVLDKALVMFKEAAHFDKENYALWHKISLAFFRQGNLEEAQQYNRRTLRLKNDYAPARQLEEAIKKQLEPDGGRLGRLFGR